MKRSSRTSSSKSSSKHSIMSIVSHTPQCSKPPQWKLVASFVTWRRSAFQLRTNAICQVQCPEKPDDGNDECQILADTELPDGLCLVCIVKSVG